MFDNVSNQAKQSLLLNAILRALTINGITISTETSSGIPSNVATEATLDLVEDYTKFAVWDKIAGNNILLTYYNGVEAGNPSGNTNNIKTIAYRTGLTVILTQTITYTVADNISSITAA